jgi:hypothetical protein
MSILLGLCFVAMLPLVLALRKEAGSWGRVGTVATLATVLGTLASMSSGPLLGLVVTLGCAALLLKPALVKPVLGMFLILVVAAEIASNRHFYYLIDYVTLGQSDTWYRARLFEVAMAKLPEYWLLGYGYQDPGWGPLIDQRVYTDVCNGYILAAVTGGVIAALLLMSMIAMAVWKLRKAYRASRDAMLRRTAWYVGSMLLGYAFALWSVGLLGTMQTLFYLMIGIAWAPIFDAARTRTGAIRQAGV